MLKLKLQCFGQLMQRTDLLEKTLMLGKIKGRRRRDDRGWDGWMASPTHWTWIWASSGSCWWTGKPGMLQSMGSQSQTQLSDWIELSLLQLELSWAILVALLEQRVTAFGEWVHSKENTKCPVEAVSGPGTNSYPCGWTFSPQLYRVLSFQPALVWGFLWPFHSEVNFPHHHSPSHFQVLIL